MAKKKKAKKEDKDFSESKQDELSKILEERTEIEKEIRKLKEKRKEKMLEEGKLKTIIKTIGGDK